MTILDGRKTARNPGTPAEWALDAALDELRNAFDRVTAELLGKLDEADEAAAKAMQEAETAREDVEEIKETLASSVMDLAVRLHDRDRHPGNIRFCTVDACTSWTDFAREKRWVW